MSSTSSVSQSPKNFDFIRPKLITVIRNGSKPRKVFRILLNKKTAQSIEQILCDITNIVNLNSGAVKKLFTFSGKQASGVAF